MSVVRGLTLAEQVRLASEKRNDELEAALESVMPRGERTEIELPSGLRVRLKKTPLSQILGGNPLDSQGDPSDDEIMKMMKISRGAQ
jgi:hypothetical protein